MLVTFIYVLHHVSLRMRCYDCIYIADQKVATIFIRSDPEFLQSIKIRAFEFAKVIPQNCRFHSQQVATVKRVIKENS